MVVVHLRVCLCRHWSMLAQLMASCLMAPNHYPNQRWLVTIAGFWHSPENNFVGNKHDILYNKVKKTLRFTTASIRANTVTHWGLGRNKQQVTGDACILIQGDLYTLSKTSLQFVLNGPTHNQPTYNGSSRTLGKPLPETMIAILMGYICVTRIQWFVKDTTMSHI